MKPLLVRFSSFKRLRRTLNLHKNRYLQKKLVYWYEKRPRLAGEFAKTTVHTTSVVIGSGSPHNTLLLLLLLRRWQPFVWNGQIRMVLQLQ
jgi:hypothetical protein